MTKRLSLNPKQPVLVLFGPTASGKTDLLFSLFSAARSSSLPPAELVSADSMQVYKGMDIGTAKPSSGLQKLLPHHLVDIREINEGFNAGDFVRLADSACAEIAGRGALPVVCGGTGFYLKNFIYGLPAAPPCDPLLRARLKEELALKGQEALMAELAGRDRESAARIHGNDTYRLLRALEVCRLTGLPLRSFAPGDKARECYRFLIVELYRPREELYRRIEKRCGEMFRAGLAVEVQGLFRKGWTPDDPGMRAIGYREFFIENTEETGGGPETPRWMLSQDIEGAMALVIRNSRRYAKRQMTFFSSIKREEPDARLVRLDAEEAAGRLLDLLPAFLHTMRSAAADPI